LEKRENDLSETGSRTGVRGVEFTHPHVILLHDTIGESGFADSWRTDEKDGGGRSVSEPLKNTIFNGWMKTYGFS
jgi:hypothetical protein